MRDALMLSEHAAVAIDDVAGLHRVRPQTADDVRVAPGRYEADVLAVMLVGDGEPEAPCKIAHLRLGHVAERKAQIFELLARGRKQEIALIAIGVGRAGQCARSVWQTARGDVMAGGKHLRAEFARGLEQIAEFYRAIALDAGHRRLAQRIAFGKGVDHRFAEALLVIQNVMRDADPFGHVARVVNVLAGTAGALAMRRRAVIVKLQRDPDDIVTFGFQQRSRRRGVDAAGHGDHDSRIFGTAFKVETVEHCLHIIDRTADAIHAFRMRKAKRKLRPSEASSRGSEESVGRKR